MKPMNMKRMTQGVRTKEEQAIIDSMKSPGTVKVTGVLPFWRFCKEVVGLELTIGQRVIAKVCLDKMELSQLPPEEREVAYKIFELVPGQTIPAKARKTICLRFGRGSGKSTLTSLMALYLSLTADLSKCGKGDMPTVAIFAPDKNTASDVCLNMVFSYMDETPSLKRFLVGKDEQTVTVKRPDGKIVRIKALAPAKGGKNIRGRSIIALIMDEAEFFNSDPDGGYVINDRDVYKSVTPRMIKGGLTFFISTPWPSENLMSEFMAKNLGNPTQALCAVATTTLMRPDNQELMEQIDSLRALDPETAAREFDCNTEGLLSGTFFDSKALASAVNENMDIAYNPRFPTAAAVDFAFKRDSSALAIVQWDGNKYKLVRLHEITPKGKPLVPSQVCKEFADICAEYSITQVITDNHYVEAVREWLQAAGISILEAPDGVKGKMEVYVRTKACLDEGKCELPNDARFLRSAREIISKPGSGGLLTIKSPRRVGTGHGDTVSAWTNAVHHLAWSHVRHLKPERETDYSKVVKALNDARELKWETQHIRESENAIKGKGKWRLA